MTAKALAAERILDNRCAVRCLEGRRGSLESKPDFSDQDRLTCLCPDESDFGIIGRMGGDRLASDGVALE